MNKTFFKSLHLENNPNLNNLRTKISKLLITNSVKIYNNNSSKAFCIGKKGFNSFSNFSVKNFSSKSKDDNSKSQSDLNSSIDKLSLGNSNVHFFKVNSGLSSNEFKIPILKELIEISDSKSKSIPVTQDTTSNYAFDNYEFHSFYFKESDKVNEFVTRLNEHFKVNKISISLTDLSGVEINQEDNLRSILSDEFIIKVSNTNSKIKINKSIVYCLPDLNRALFSLKNREFVNINSKHLLNTKLNIDEFNNLLLTNTKSNSKINEFIEKLISRYSEIEKELSKVKSSLDSSINKEIYKLSLLALMYFIVHCIVFYVLIYQLYGWDNIEPITYLVGNVYWIVGLTFFAFKKKKLDLDFLLSKSFRINLHKKLCGRFRYNTTSHLNVKNELKELIAFKEALTKNI